MPLITGTQITFPNLLQSPVKEKVSRSTEPGQKRFYRELGILIHGVVTSALGVSPDIKSLVEDCDALIVLAPSNPEHHERLADLPLQSGKPLFIDKPFTTDKASAERIFTRAEKSGTPIFSCSALRYPSGLTCALQEAPYDFVSTTGGGEFNEYIIHQIEMVNLTMGTGVEKLLRTNNGDTNHCILKFNDGRLATMTQGKSFTWTGKKKQGAFETVTDCQDCFTGLVNVMLAFLKITTCLLNRKTV